MLLHSYMSLKDKHSCKFRIVWTWNTSIVNCLWPNMRLKYEVLRGRVMAQVITPLVGKKNHQIAPIKYWSVFQIIGTEQQKFYKFYWLKTYVSTCWHLWFITIPFPGWQSTNIWLAFSNYSKENSYLDDFIMNFQFFELTFSWRTCRWLLYRKCLLNIIWKCSTHHWFWAFLILGIWHIWRENRKPNFIDHQNNCISNIKGRKTE